MNDYLFRTPCPDGHFVQQWVKYVAKLSDASHEYSEAVALLMLAQACSSMAVRLSALPDALHPNLYVLLVGPSTTSRKSVSAGRGVRVIEHALPGVVVPDAASPEAMHEILAEQEGARLAYFDEFQQVLVRWLTQDRMEAMQALLLQLYDSRKAHCVRTKKKKKKDESRIRYAVVSLLGCVTPTLFQHRAITSCTIRSGLMPRFAIVYPQSKPPRMPIAQISAETHTEGNRFVRWLHDLYLVEWDASFGEGVLDQLDRDVDQVIERDGCEMSVRLPIMAKRVAMLVAAGRHGVVNTQERLPDVDEGLGGAASIARPIVKLLITKDDARIAAEIVLRWHGYAQMFDQSVGQSRLEAYIDRVAAFMARPAIRAKRLQAGDVPLQGVVTRREVARHLKVDARTMKEIEATLCDRGLIEIMSVTAGNKASTLWKWNDMAEARIS